VPAPITATRCIRLGSTPLFIKVAPSASSAMVRPPDAEPVSAARMLVATESETNGPLAIPRTHTFTALKAGNDATHCAEADQARHADDRQHRRVGACVHGFPQVGKRLKLVVINTRIAAASATMTDQTPPTAESEVAPHCASFRKEAHSCLGTGHNPEPPLAASNESRLT